ncbi:MAG: ATP-dependent helicase DinG [Candidatus Sumerlaeota bacterium]|nr:ATP-dependent helicase DinG [Candidatus Sumerlaeota bacterium]
MSSALPVEGSPHHYLTPEVAGQIAREIAEAGGTEVFFIGRRGQDGLVQEVEAHAYGSREAVPVLMNLVQPGEVILHNHPSGQLLPSEADLNISAMVGNLGVGSFIVNNDCSRLRVIIRPQTPKEKSPVSLGQVEQALGPGSPLAAELGGYENRPEQRHMAVSVAEALNNDGIAVIEAGTGTGKSLAYLIPSLLYALENKERIVVSTHTINLQEQILHKDLPVVRRALGREFRAEIVKGRSNYVCKRKAQMAREELVQPQQTLIEDEFRVELRELLVWAKESATGDRTELSVPPREQAWERVASESDNCLRLKCPFYEECFFYNSRRVAARADILIVNHSLLLSDIAVRRESGNWSTAAVLPPYKHVVLDEAHHLEDVATRHLGSQITRPAIRRLFGRLARTDTSASKRRGLFANLGEKLEELRKDGLIGAESRTWKILLYDLMPGIDHSRETVETFVDEFAYAFMELARLEPPRRGLEHRVRILSRHTLADAWEGECAGCLHALAREIGLFVDRNREAIEGLNEFDEASLERLRDTAMEWRAIVDRLDHYRRLAMSFLRDDPEMCRWVEIGLDRRDRMSTRICQAPISVAAVLRDNLHEKMHSEILTSATLAVDEDFDFLFERIGLRSVRQTGATASAADSGFDPAALEEGEADGADLPVPAEPAVPAARPVERMILGSSFDYAGQVFLGVPSGLGDPRNAGFEDRLADFICKAVAVSGGRAFILFTSWAQMKRLHARCAPAIRRFGIESLLQGEESRDRLLRRFREDETSVLFATSSFWEGVDVRGRALELLIIAKLPFSVPNDPVQEAQYERLQQQGRDAFNSLVVPRAIIRLKQGFGRLIRSRTDRGAVLIADDRLLRMNYGRRFLRSLPRIEPCHQPAGPLLEAMGEFLGRRGSETTPE